MTYAFLPVAELEFQAAVEFYDECEEGLGTEFEQEVFATIRRIVRYPDAWPQHTRRTRRCQCNRFPYSIIYRYAQTEIVIYAVMHHKRKPGYWKDRVR